MGLDDIPLFAMLKGRLGYIDARQKVIAENVANADTPGYAPRDLKPQTFAALLGQGSGAVRLAQTEAGHMSGGHRGRGRGAAAPDGGDYAEVSAPDSEARVDGNQVVLEDQMMKMTESRVDYEAAVDLYQQSLNLITTAARAPGKAS